ncbi:MAG: zinc ABC transporter substrate-binding protein [Turicibacter sp.]|nr:zinc ABC transporter substrate-binding protein [Turicibacter sp.]
MNKFTKIFGALSLAAFLGACAQETTEEAPTTEAPTIEEGTPEVPDSPLQVIATTTIVADLIANIGGSRVEVEYLMGPGIDPHYHVASAGDLNRLDSADIIVFHGLNLEERMAEIFENMASQGRNVISTEEAIAADLRLFEEDYEEYDEAGEEEEEHYDPHIWFDASLWKLVADHFAEQLSEIDPSSADYFQDNLQTHRDALAELHQYIQDRTAEVPEESRVIITAHDAFQYFGQAYGFEVMGVQGMSTTAEASTADIAALADFIVDRGISAIFVETSVSSRNIEAVIEAAAARGHEVVIGGYLYSDALGDAGSGHDTYIGMMRANIATIVDALR